ncbi:unnamed protein product [Cylicocyclus nassatus]|uniref:IST1 homolog n=1 Tax=Cylicocyclus nassatus TaxID=53992 RepID=A0AA36H3D1_CYLNA|nr:unnamed protein product [Cylicocyclus nassatus]
MVLGCRRLLRLKIEVMVLMKCHEQTDPNHKRHFVAFVDRGKTAKFKTISDQLTIKYGKPVAEAARANQLEFPAKVSPKLISKLSVAAPPKVMVERYMIEIAAVSAGVPFTPDPDVMRDDEVAQAEKMLIDFKQAVPSSGGIPPAAPPSDDHLVIGIRENLLLEKKLGGLLRDVEELKRQQLLKASAKIPTILKSAICHSDVAVLMFLILMFCVVTTSAQYLPTAEKKVVVCGCDITVSWQDALLNLVLCSWEP